ncbi:bifunctional hydroxymethylpyrimidine kinase/phosphomethylpyrimidine kinase [Vulgatibacter incomptus]|uniref:hydroxymethylpyrimidine kinase n=1 Tax=Vulgatibacter incomptus TaxID=1391653 RepID=A0A0K1PFA7_9BACT|nr:bifunctional hydroxymethylpyrimidine kinase/phosphomethylpyrimidine kinase [Vulgatibacter incomptus]AKU92197.1 Hydroxymethylpyrimidine phosphate kinase ThiD [Vulgatibacter incomptus]
MRKALTIAGSDSGGGAGIQADLKTFFRFGVYGTSAITLVTAQNTVGVQGVYPIAPEAILAQVESVAGDLRPDATKTGALGSPEAIEAVAWAVERHGLWPLVVDPVMISKHGAPLLGPEAIDALKRHLLPKASLLTPNLHEAGALLGATPVDEGEMREAARALAALGPKAVWLKGGSLPGELAIDILFDGEELHRFSAPKLATRSTHGTGCTASAAITAGLALGQPLREAVADAKDFIQRAISNGPDLGKGLGPVDHMG